MTYNAHRAGHGGNDLPSDYCEEHDCWMVEDSDGEGVGYHCPRCDEESAPKRLHAAFHCHYCGRAVRGGFSDEGGVVCIICDVTQRPKNSEPSASGRR